MHPHKAHVGALHRMLQRQGRHLCAWWHPCCSQKSSCHASPRSLDTVTMATCSSLHSPHCSEEQELSTHLPRQCRGCWREQTSHKNLFPVAGWRQEPESVWPNSHNKHGAGVGCSQRRNCGETEKEQLKLKTRAGKTWGRDESMGMRET